MTPRAPLAVRAANRALRPCRRLLERRLPLDVDALCESASRETGLDDLGDPSCREPLTALVDGLREEGDLTPLGRLALRSYVRHALVSRLRVVREAALDPSVERPRIEPLIVTGFYRSGTTYLHRLLAAPSSVRAPSFGELRNPSLASRPGGRERAERAAHRALAVHRRLSPDARAAHPMAADAPEECVHLFEAAFWTTTSTFMSASTHLAELVVKSDPRPAYRLYRTQLGLLNRVAPTRRWVLKWPMHMCWLDTLFETLPTARVVVLERDPVEAFVSVCGFTELIRTPFCRAIDRSAIGAFWIEYLARCRARFEATLTSLPAERIRRVPYTELLARPVELAHDLLAWGGPPLDEAARAAVAARASEPRPAARRGRPLTPERYGLSAEAIYERLGPGFVARQVIERTVPRMSS